MLGLHEELWELELSDEQKSDMVNMAEHLVSEYEKSEDTVQYHNDIYKWHDQYEGILPAKDYPWEGCANYHVPITEMNVNAYYSRIIRRFRGMDYLKVKQYREIKDRAILTQRYLRYLFIKKIGWVDLGMTVFRDIIKYGTGIFCTTFDFTERKKKAVVPRTKMEEQIDPFTKEKIQIPGVDYVIEEHTYFDMKPKVEWVDLLDYFRSDDSDRFAVPAWEARRIWKSAVDLWQLGNSEEFDKENTMALLRKELESQEMSETNPKKKGVEYLNERELIEWWGWMRIEKDPLSEPVRLVLWYDRKSRKFLKAIRFPYFFDESNFTIINFERRANTWRGRGICEKLE